MLMKTYKAQTVLRVVYRPPVRCVYQHADEKGTTGVALDRNLVHVAGRALQVTRTITPLLRICRNSKRTTKRNLRSAAVLPVRAMRSHTSATCIAGQHDADGAACAAGVRAGAVRAQLAGASDAPGAQALYPRLPPRLPPLLPARRCLLYCSLCQLLHTLLSGPPPLVCKLQLNCSSLSRSLSSFRLQKTMSPSAQHCRLFSKNSGIVRRGTGRDRGPRQPAEAG
jgi:FAE1/Type III polyketide synthase-like protein